MRLCTTRPEIIEWVSAIIVVMMIVAFVLTFLGRTFLVEGVSMEPTLEGGERILVNKLSYRTNPPARGDIVVFRYPSDPSRIFVKRVIGLPGEQVEIYDGTVYVDGVELHENYRYSPIYSDYGPVSVPENSVFVLGDNRNNSHDSRSSSVGMVPFESLEGRAVAVYWPIRRSRLIRGQTYPHMPERPFRGVASAPGARW